MATLNVGSMAARLGLDPSEFLDKMKGVQGFNGLMSGEMSRDMSGSVVTDDLMRRTEGVAMIHASQKHMMAAMPAMQREISLRKRT